MIDQLRELLRARPFVPFGIEMSNGRRFNVYDAIEAAVSYDENGGGTLGIAQGNAFVIVNPAQIVSVGPTLHPVRPKPPTQTP